MNREELFKEIAYGLGLSEEEPKDATLQTFQIIQEIFDRSAGNCFFCTSIYGLDPNNEEDRRNATLCGLCQHKLDMLLEIMGDKLKAKERLDVDRLLH